MALLLSPMAAKQSSTAKDDTPLQSHSRFALLDVTNSSPFNPPGDSNNRVISRSDSEAIGSLFMLAGDQPRDRDQGFFDDDNLPPPMLPPSEHYLQDNNGRDNNHDNCSSNESNNNTDEGDAIEEELEGASDSNNTDEEDASEEDIESALAIKQSASQALSQRVHRCMIKSMDYESNACSDAGACAGAGAGAGAATAADATTAGGTADAAATEDPRDKSRQARKSTSFRLTEEMNSAFSRLVERISRAEAPGQTGKKPRKLKEDSWQYDWKRRACKDVDWGNTASILDFLPKRSKTMLQPPSNLVKLFECPLLKSHAVYFFNNKLEKSEQIQLRNALTELKRFEGVVASIERKAERKAMAETKEKSKKPRNRQHTTESAQVSI